MHLFARAAGCCATYREVPPGQLREGGVRSRPFRRAAPDRLKCQLQRELGWSLSVAGEPSGYRWLQGERVELRRGRRSEEEKGTTRERVLASLPVLEARGRMLRSAGHCLGGRRDGWRPFGNPEKGGPLVTVMNKARRSGQIV